MAPPNIIVFGETGAGKSALINLIAGDGTAESNSSAKGVTIKSTTHYANIDGTTVTLHDTAGLDEWHGGSVSAKDAITGLYQLICKLDDGVSLLVYCIRGPRIRASHKNNYQMFYEAICQRKVPIVVVVTGLENETPTMESWWEINGSTFAKYGMKFQGHVCACGTKGKDNNSLAEYNESGAKLKTLVVGAHMRHPWKIDRMNWVEQAVRSTWNFFAKGFSWEKTGKKGLTAAYKLMGMSSKEAIKLANRVA